MDNELIFRIIVIFAFVFVSAYIHITETRQNKKLHNLLLRLHDNNSIPKEVLKLKKLNSLAKVPVLGSEYAAGVDLCAAIDYSITIEPGQTVKIGTGLAMEIPEGYFGALFARSGLGINQGLAPANCVGVIDSDYRAEVIVALYNHSSETRTIEPQERIAQLVVIPYASLDLKTVKELNETKRNGGGLGSTGLK